MCARIFLDADVEFRYLSRMYCPTARLALAEKEMTDDATFRFRAKKIKLLNIVFYETRKIFTGRTNTNEPSTQFINAVSDA